jgi:hypothetical protein
MKILKNIWFVVKIYPLAKAQVLAHSNSQYIGSVRTQIAYNVVRTAIVKSGLRADDEITGAVIYLTISLAYLLNK